MNYKILTFASLAIVLVASIVIAAVDITISPTSFDFTTDDEEKTFVLTNNVDEALDLTYSQIGTIEQDGNVATFQLISPPDTVGALGTEDIIVKFSGNPLDFRFGDYAVGLTVTATNQTDPADNVTENITLGFDRGFCKSGQVGTNNISVDIKDIDNSGDSDDSEDDQWILGDEIEIEVEVENLLQDEDLDDITVEMGLFDSSGNNVADDLDFAGSDDEEVDAGDINEDDEETLFFEFRVPPDFDVENYVLVFKAYEDGEEDFLCAEDEFGIIDVDQESDDDRLVIVDDIILDSTQVTCGETVTGEFTVFNIGDSDQERVLITMENAALDLDQEFEITSDLDEGEDEDFSFSFPIPAGASDGTHAIEFRTSYEYDDGFYEERSDDTFVGLLSVLGCSVPLGGDPTATGGRDDVVISASLSSGAAAGEELVITSLITNLGSETLTMTVDARAFQSWADLTSVSPSVITVAPGQSATVTLTFDVNEDTSGSQSFIIETNANGNLEVQEVEVNIEGEETSEGFSGLGDNGLIWVIAIVNIILIILIILVAVRLSRR